jgi:hypothetical protein
MVPHCTAGESLLARFDPTARRLPVKAAALLVPRYAAALTARSPARSDGSRAGREHAAPVRRPTLPTHARPHEENTTTSKVILSRCVVSSYSCRLIAVETPVESPPVGLRCLRRHRAAPHDSPRAAVAPQRVCSILDAQCDSQAGYDRVHGGDDHCSRRTASTCRRTILSQRFA